MSNICEVTTARQEAAEQMAAHLESVVAAIRSGDVIGYALMTLASDQTFGSSFGGDISYLERLGALEAVKADIIAQAEDRA